MRQEEVSTERHLIPGTGDYPVPCLEGTIDEANFGDAGWAPLFGSGVLQVAQWRTILEIKPGVRERRPVALIGVDHGQMRRRWGNQLAGEITHALEHEREHRLYQLSDLLGVEGVAKLLGVTTDAVYQWSHRHADFPEPLLETYPLLWDRREILTWAKQTGRISPNTARDRRQDWRHSPDAARFATDK